MLHEQDDQKDEKIVKLVNQVKTLSKIVNELQEEVDSLKSKASIKDNISTAEESKIAEANESKLNRSQRLNFSRKDNKTNEEIAAIKINASKKIQTTDDVNKKSNENSRDMLIKHQKQVANQTSATEPFFENESPRRNRSTQSVPFPKEVEFSCIVETYPAEAGRNIEKSKNSQESTELESNFETTSTCKGFYKKKKPKTQKDKIKSSSKFKTSKCDKDCPYLTRNNEEDKKKKKKCKSKGKEYEAKDDTYVNKNNQCKNKKVMVNFFQNDKIEALKFISNNDNLSFDCKLFESSSCVDEEEINRPQTTKLHLLDLDGKCIKVKETYCKRCFKKCKTKNILKINKAILTHDQPVIITAPRST